MTLDENLKREISSIFSSLNTAPAARSFPGKGSLSEKLSNIVIRRGATNYSVNNDVTKEFATAAVDMWHRSVHSFLLSISLKEASPIWSSVCGYYASHYSMRGIAHLLGYFYLFSKKKVVELSQKKSGGFTCSFNNKPNIPGSGEHTLYWYLVKKHSAFSSDNLFLDNIQKSGNDVSDGGHRNMANYSDHLCCYPEFNPLDKEEILDRVDRISRISFVDAPIPRRDRFPDLDSVHIVAYHRIVTFRKILDESLGGNRFWNVHRDPPFARDYMNYQLNDESVIGDITA